MNISAIGPSPMPPVSAGGERGRDIHAIGQALASGDLQGAQDAFKAFKQDFHRVHQGGGLAQSNVPTEIKDDLRALQSALKANDLEGAQQAFMTFKADMHQMQAPKPQVVPGSSKGALNVMA